MAERASIVFFSQKSFNSQRYSHNLYNGGTPFDAKGWQAFQGIEAQWALHAHCNLCYLPLDRGGEMEEALRF